MLRHTCSSQITTAAKAEYQKDTETVAQSASKTVTTTAPSTSPDSTEMPNTDPLLFVKATVAIISSCAPSTPAIHD